MAENFWKRCSSCKKEILLNAAYWACSVSSCNRKGSSYVFCTVGCWDAHVPVMRHREAWAEEKRAPATQAESDAGTAKRRIVKRSSAPGQSSPTPTQPASEPPMDTLIVASKLKAYIKARAGMNTSDGVLEELSDIVRGLCNEAIDRAREEGRKTVLDRDF